MRIIALAAAILLAAVAVPAAHAAIIVEDFTGTAFRSSGNPGLGTIGFNTSVTGSIIIDTSAAPVGVPNAVFGGTNYTGANFLSASLTINGTTVQVAGSGPTSAAFLNSSAGFDTVSFFLTGGGLSLSLSVSRSLTFDNRDFLAGSTLDSAITYGRRGFDSQTPSPRLTLANGATVDFQLETLVTRIPEPATLALLAVAGLAALRRRV